MTSSGLNGTIVRPTGLVNTPATRYIRIEGGDHHQFGAYALTGEDDLAAISREAQHAQILTATLDLLRVVAQGP